MEDTVPESVASPPSGAAKSKLDTLSKDDLIKFAKKQMAAIQKMKSKCADLEKEVDTLKSQPTGNSDDSVIQELTERMSALLLEKAETQQSAVLLRKENEKVKHREQDAVRKLATLQGELNHAKEDHQKKMATFEKTMHVSQAKHKEEVEFFQRLLREKDESDREKESEREKEKHREREKEDTNDSVEAVSHSLESQILSLQTELAVAVERSAQEAAVLQEDHQRAQTEAQQEVENLREELAQHSMQHEEELRALEEDFEMERERLLLLQEELSEQLALKDSFLQDVQEEEEEPSGRSSGIARMLELSGLSQIDASDGETETGQLRSALEDLQSQNTMLQDELTFLGNVKTQLEAELERMREEFQTEKEELEFKIDELLMTREGATPDLNMTPYRDPLNPATPKCDLQEVPALTQLQQSGPQREPAYCLPASSASPSSPFPDTDHQSLTLEEQQRLILEVQELRTQCETLASKNTQAVGECESLAKERCQAVDECEYLARERGQAVAECEHTRDILRGLETELGQRTGDFVRQYEAMKEQGASAIHELQERVRGLTEERESLVEKLRVLNEDRESLLEEVQGLEKRLESFLEQTQAAEGLKEQLQTSLEEKTELALEFKTSLEEKTELALEFKTSLEEKTVLASELKASLEEQTALTLELKASVEDLSRQNGEILSQLQMKESALQELEDSLNVVCTERDQTLSALQEREMEVVRLKEVEGRQGQRERVAELQARIEELEKERSLLKSSLGEVQGSPGEEVEELQARIEELEKERSLLKSSLGEVQGSPGEEVEELQARIEELEKERSLLKSSLWEVQGSPGEEVEELQARIEELEKERSLLKSSLGEVQGRPGEEVEELQARIEELEKERSLLKSSLGEVQGRPGEEVEELQARIEELEKERSLLKSSLGEVQGRPGEEVEELQACVEELEKERNLLKCNLGELVGDTEALQRDLVEMKLANEKMRTENQELLAQVSNATETLADKEREQRVGGEMEREEEEKQEERRALQQQLTEKDKVISQLKSEMAVLQSTASTVSEEKNTDIEFTEKIALLEKESKEKNERMNKIKAVAVKARKELDTSRKEAVSLKEEVEVLKAEREKVTSSMKDIIHGAEGYKNLQLDYDRQTEQLDKEREKVEGAEKQISELTKRLNTAVQQHEQLWSEREDLMTGMETLRSTVRQMEGQTAELHRQTDTLNRDHQAERLLKEQKTKELSSLQKEVEELTAQLRRQKQQSQQTARELEQLRKEAQQSSLLDMEMADYERLVKELNTNLSEKDVCVEELKTLIHTHTQKEDTLNQEIEGLKSQLDQGEDKGAKMKQLLVKTKKDLADAKRQEASQMMTLASLKGELETHQQELENSKIRCCDLSGERHRLHEQLRTLTEQQQRTSSTLQHRLTSLQQEFNTAQAELSFVTTEFDSYKVRVHNVLKQQKNKSSAQSDGHATKQEREQMESMVDQYKAKLQDSQQCLAVSTAEFQQLQMEHDTLLERHNKILQETVTKEAELRERLLSLQAESMSLRTELAQTVGQLTSQADAQRSGFREQIRHLQDEHRTTVETLQNQMTRLENQLFTLQSQTAPVQTSRKPVVDRRTVDQGAMGGLGLSDLQSMAREEGEGMETTETESLSLPHTPLPSLEHLLTSPDPKQEPFVWQVEPTKEELSQKLATATRSMEHMNMLLHETEATNAVLMEQVNLLKSEVRRLERNHEREKSVANLEYLKNVLLQFIFLQSGSERRALLPVIHTMLQLSPEEKNKLAAIAMGEEEVGGAKGSGWTSYLHSWSGIR
ncbi:GRIP and coiled-coil domain-containing protein 2 isoform X2 [Oncorhynchus kisutch]|uniref:GRIP and coiled-coil domain-containing protein 2 isoform X2 n=1 Tax=Oncorhynchus kisutch TaxID=8019 RepID=UPI0012DD3C5D|nr:GRIP and coiled-coil domain-containing protein 2 isoform X2 [Oncorhynchus kisutch]